MLLFNVVLLLKIFCAWKNPLGKKLFNSKILGTSTNLIITPLHGPSKDLRFQHDTLTGMRQGIQFDVQFARLECDNRQYIQNLTRLPYVPCH